MPKRTVSPREGPPAAERPDDATPADPNEALVRRLYACLAARDGAGMAACYAPDATFEDPVFGRLHGDEVGAMWRMLTERATRIDVAVPELVVEGDEGHAIIHATYPYGRGRLVRNILHARFWFRQGLIVRHEDRFSLWRWSRMALGPLGVAFGWTPLVRARIRDGARRGLRRHMAKESSGPATP